MAKKEEIKKIENKILWKLIRNSALSLILGFLGYWVVISLFPLFVDRNVHTRDWQLLEGFASLISLVLLIGGATFAITEYIHKERARIKEQEIEDREKNKLSYEIYQAIFAKITDPEQEAARRWILQNLNEKKADESLEAWYNRENQKVMPNPNSDEITEGQKAIKLTLNSFDYIGFIADHFWEVDDDALDWISAPIAKVWDRLGPYVERVKELRGVQDYYLSAQSIGNRCVAWRESKGLGKENIAENTP